MCYGDQSDLEYFFLKFTEKAERKKTTGKPFYLKPEIN